MTNQLIDDMIPVERNVAADHQRRPPMTEVEIKAEWERRTEKIRYYHADVIFRGAGKKEPRAGNGRGS